MPLVRLQFEDCDGQYAPFNLDLFVDDAGIVDDRQITYGRWGPLDGDELWPFIVRPRPGKGEANLDFGFNADDPDSQDERFGWTNITAKCIKLGELVTFRYGEDDVCQRVMRVVSLPSGEIFTPKVLS